MDRGKLRQKDILLLPEIFDQIRRQDPGAKLGVAESNYGGVRQPGGLVAQADALDMFGRYGFFAAAYWSLSPRDSVNWTRSERNSTSTGKVPGSATSGWMDVRGGTLAAESLDAVRDTSNRVTLVAVRKAWFARAFSVRSATSHNASVRGFAARHDQPFEPESAPVATLGGNVRFTVRANGLATVEITS